MQIFLFLSQFLLLLLLFFSTTLSLSKRYGMAQKKKDAPTYKEDRACNFDCVAQSNTPPHTPH